MAQEPQTKSSWNKANASNGSKTPGIRLRFGASMQTTTIRLCESQSHKIARPLYVHEGVVRILRNAGEQGQR